MIFLGISEQGDLIGLKYRLKKRGKFDNEARISKKA